MDKNNPELWGIGGDDELTAYDPSDAIEQYIEDINDEDLPFEVEVIGYTRVRPTIHDLQGRLIDYAMEILDEEYGDPEAPIRAPHSGQDAIYYAELHLIEEILKHYTPWLCREVIKKVYRLYLNDDGTIGWEEKSNG